MITALDYTSDDDFIVPGTPDSRAEGEEAVKPFRIEELPTDVIKHISEFWTVNEIQKLKFECSSRVLREQLCVYMQREKIFVNNNSDIFHYFNPTLTSAWLWDKARELIFSVDSNRVEKLDERDQSYFKCRSVPIVRCSGAVLNEAMCFVDFKYLKEVYIDNGDISEAFFQLESANKLQVLSIKTKDLCSYGTQLPLTLEQEIPSLRVLKLPKTTKFFLQEQQTLARYCPKLERVEEARTIWEKVDGKWFAETEATEVKVELSTKRKRLTLDEVKYRPGEVFRCNNCNGRKQTNNPYMAPEVSLCPHCFTGTKNLLEMQNQIEKFKRQRTCNKCEKGAVCTCERVLALDDFMLTDYQ